MSGACFGSAFLLKSCPALIFETAHCRYGNSLRLERSDLFQGFIQDMWGVALLLNFKLLSSQ